MKWTSLFRSLWKNWTYKSSKITTYECLTFKQNNPFLCKSDSGHQLSWNSGNFVYPQNSLPFCNFDLFSRMTSIVHLMPSAASCLAERCCIPYFCLRHFTLFTSDTTSMLLSSHLMHICIACRLGFAHLSCYTYSSISSNKWKHSIEMYLYGRCARGKKIHIIE